MDSTGLRRNELDWELSWIQTNEFEMFNRFELMKRELKKISKNGSENIKNSVKKTMYK